MEKLTKLRKLKNLTQKDLGKVLKLSCKTISAYERGTRTPNLLTMKGMANYFGCTIDELIFEENSKQTEGEM